MRIKLHNAWFRLWNRVFDWINPRQLGKRIQTYPFLSSDAYAIRISKSLFRFEDFSSRTLANSKSTNSSSVYIPFEIAETAASLLIDFDEEPKTIVLGDDDRCVEPGLLESLFPYAKNIFATNLVNESEIVSSIPLGLESPSYRSGGSLRDFKRTPTNSPRKRAITFLVSWNSETNLGAREAALSAFKSSPFSFYSSKRLTHQTFHRLVRKSLFLPCPPGNGLDTHRIWECLYLGAVPIVHKDHAFAALNGWPIWIVADWNEALSFSREELEQKYRDLVLPRSELLELSRKVFQKIEAK